MTTALAAPNTCCPESIGEVCWDDGSSTGTAFAVFQPSSNTTLFFDALTGNPVDPADIVPCPLATEQTTMITVLASSVFNIPGGGSTLKSWSVLAATGTPSVNVNTGGAIALLTGERVTSNATTGAVLNDTVQVTTGAGQTARVMYSLLT